MTLRYAKCVRTQLGLTTSFKIEKSVLQGESLSPKLFTLFLDDIVDEMNAIGVPGVRISKHEVHMLLFADDIVLMATCQKELQAKIDKLKEFFENNNLRVNLSKTKVVVFRKAYSMRKCSLTWGSDEIEQVKDYTYLGVPFHYSGKFNLACDHFITKSKQAIARTLTICAKGKIGNFKVQEQLFGSLCRSVLFYAAVIWGCEKLDELVKVQFYFLRKLFYLPKEMPRWKMLLETGARPIENSLLSVLLKFLHRLRNKPKDSLIYCCYEMLLKYQSRMQPDRNWSSIVNTTFTQWCVPKLDLSLKFIATPREIKQIVSKHWCNITNNLVNDMQLRENDIYKQLKRKIGGEFYLNCDIPFACKRLVFQFRSNLNYVTYKGKACKLKGCRSENYENCDLCNLKDSEDVFHI